MTEQNEHLLSQILDELKSQTAAITALNETNIALIDALANYGFNDEYDEEQKFYLDGSRVDD